MDLPAWILWSSGLTHGGPPYSFSLSPVAVVPMVPNLVSSPRVLGKRALVKSPSALSCME
jgi:hypothetical protein